MEKAFSEAAGDSLGTPDGGLMCTGPMKFGSWESGQSLTLTRNDDYWDPDNAANTDEIVFSFTSDSSSLAQALASGELDGAYEVPPAVIPNLQDSDAGQVLFGAPSTLNLGLSLFTTDGPLSDPDVRQAFSSTIDRRRWRRLPRRRVPEPAVHDARLVGQRRLVRRRQGDIPGALGRRRGRARRLGEPRGGRAGEDGRRGGRLRRLAHRPGRRSPGMPRSRRSPR